LLKNSEAGEARVVAAVSDRRNSMTYVEAALIERRYHEFFTNLPGPVGGKSWEGGARRLPTDGKLSRKSASTFCAAANVV